MPSHPPVVSPANCITQLLFQTPIVPPICCFTRLMPHLPVVIPPVVSHICCITHICVTNCCILIYCNIPTRCINNQHHQTVAFPTSCGTQFLHHPFAVSPTAFLTHLLSDKPVASNICSITRLLYKLYLLHHILYMYVASYIYCIKHLLYHPPVVYGLGFPVHFGCFQTIVAVPPLS